MSKLVETPVDRSPIPRYTGREPLEAIPRKSIMSEAEGLTARAPVAARDLLRARRPRS